MNIKSYCDYKHNKNMFNANKKMNSVKKRALDFLMHICLYIEEERGKGRNTRAGSHVVKK